ncbi:hypothetical protein [Sphingopyxis sp. Geo48]|uniref:hypothetical protein n=1 Tax=Sphingopyxis sp. Geo48 TaxID=545241 RepID=UPI0024B78B0E|nr:hypothetical protein [Sphingopyxis sp. Geo48]
MITKSLFCFGFENPREAELNASDETDYESSTGIWIEGQSDDEVMAWGRAIAEQLVVFLFERAQIEPYSWAARGFAHWIEREPEALSMASYLPSVSVGEMPDLTVLAGDAAYD